MEAVIFIGIQASGKSTFYFERFSATHTRINLDTLKTRRRERAVLQSCIREGRPFVVDNTNVLERERALYIPIAIQAGFQVTGYFFQTPLNDALLRNRQREGKTCIPDRGIIGKYRVLQPPRFEEGFDRLYSVAVLQPGGFSVWDWSPENAKTGLRF
jgi:predicted kinase